MDELHRLYEHQTMMAIGIYSFLDNLLAHIPSRPELDAGTAPNLSESTDALDQTEPTRLRADRGEFSGNLIEVARTSNLAREIPDGLRLFPRLSTWSIHSSLPLRPDIHRESNVDMLTPDPRSSEDAERGSEPTEQTVNKVDPTPGGYPEDIFIYLSDREKQEYMCTVCYSVLKEAYQCQNEHKFCYGCIYTWSTGPSIGHDGCPVCRCDGLYAKNFDLVDRINRKRVRCLLSGCNWMGVLSEHATHEHRRYSPYELDILISSCSKEMKVSPGKDTALQQDTTLEESVRAHSPVKPEQAIVTEVANADLVESVPLVVGSMPATCEPVTTSLEGREPNVLIQSQPPPRGLTRLRRPVGSNRDATVSDTSDPSHARRGVHIRRNTSTTTTAAAAVNTNVGVPQPQLNRLSRQCTPTRITNRPVVNAQINMPNIPRPLVTMRNTRNAATTSSGSHHAEHTQRPPVLQSRRPIRRRSRNVSRQSISSGESDMQVNETTRELGSRNSVVVNNQTTPMGLRNSDEANRDTETIPTTEPTRNQAVSPPPVISTDSPPSSTFLAARSQMFPIRSASEGTAQRRNGGNTTETEQSDRRTEGCVLPAINPNATLTTVSNGPPSYEQPTNSQPSADNACESTTEPNHDLGNHEPVENTPRRPLEFRRLVPRRQGRVVEQLRETREQLAAMLRLMTMELEERRQHVISATLETATRGRRLQNFNNHLSTQLDTDGSDLSAERSPLSTTTMDTMSAQNQQNNNPSRSWNILRNLPTPDRTTAAQRIPLRLLRFTATTTGTEEDPTNIQRDFTSDRWAAYPTVTNPSLVSARSQTAEEREDDDDDDEEEEEDRPNQSVSPMLPARLLTRLRVGSITETPAPPILLVSRRRNLSTLLSELRYGNAATYGGWSSDENEEQEEATGS